MNALATKKCGLDGEPITMETNPRQFKILEGQISCMWVFQWIGKYDGAPSGDQQLKLNGGF